MSTTRERILLTGATGYIGGRLAPRLLEAGWRVRCLVRSPEKLETREWSKHPNLEMVRHDLYRDGSLAEHMTGCRQAFHLVHSMRVAHQSCQQVDNELAERFAGAAEQVGLQRIIYLGGLGETGPHLSRPLQSRREVEWRLAGGRCPVTVLRAAMIIGSGSASFEILRHLVQRHPIMITPKWARTRCQPIGVDDVLDYLQRALDLAGEENRAIDIGGPDVMTYEELMQMMAETLRIRRRILVPVPVHTPRSSSLWIHLFTPVSPGIARPLAEGLKNPVVCRDEVARELMPGPLDDARTAIAKAFRDDESASLETTFTDAGAVSADPDWADGKMLCDARERLVEASPAATFKVVSRIGGRQGYHTVNWLWQLRSMLDLAVGGPGMRLGRRDPERLACGDAVDFWRVSCVEEDRLVRLRAEMRLPGISTLEFKIVPDPESEDRCTLHQISRFKPRGLLGLAYWYAVAPLHHIVFGRMISGIRDAAAREFRSVPEPARKAGADGD